MELVIFMKVEACYYCIIVLLCQIVPDIINCGPPGSLHCGPVGAAGGAVAL